MRETDYLLGDERMPKARSRQALLHLCSKDHHTPPAIASRVVEDLDVQTPRTVADFAAGYGSLLHAAVVRWPETSCHATDVSQSAVSHMKSRFVDWRVGRCDFLSAKSRSSSPVLRPVVGDVDLILLNPPFRCIGASRFRVDVDSDVIHCGRAMAFVLVALNYLHPAGTLVAFLPAGSEPSIRDRVAWDFLRDRFEIRRLQALPKGAFRGSSHETEVYALGPPGHARNGRGNRNSPSRNHLPISTSPESRVAVRMIRGTCQMHDLKRRTASKGLPIVHSTELANASDFDHCPRVERASRTVRGPAVLIPRVGRPSRASIRLLDSTSHIALSDCVIGLEFQLRSHAVHLQSWITDHIETFRMLYCGTGAKFVTLERLTNLLHSLGYEVQGDQHA